MITKDVLDKALALPPAERAELIDTLMDSLDLSDEALDALWVREAEARIEAYESGKMRSIPARDVLAKHRQG